VVAAVAAEPTIVAAEPEPQMSDHDKVIQMLREIQATQAEPTEMLRQLREPIRMMTRLAADKVANDR
jgi:hypothetical protein